MHQLVVDGGIGWFLIFRLMSEVCQRVLVVLEVGLCLQTVFRAEPISVSRDMAARVPPQVIRLIAISLQCTRLKQISFLWMKAPLLQWWVSTYIRICWRRLCLRQTTGVKPRQVNNTDNQAFAADAGANAPAAL